MAVALLTLGQSLANPFDAQFGFALDRLLTCPTWIQFLILRDVGLAERLLLPVHYLGDVLVYNGQYSVLSFTYKASGSLQTFFAPREPHQSTCTCLGIQTGNIGMLGTICP